MEKLKLHLGCGNRKFNGYVNLDAVNTSATDKVMDATKLDYNDETVDEIFSSHLFEHIDGDVALIEWKRVLKNGGRLIIEVPDCEAVIDDVYIRQGLGWESLIAFLYGKKEPKTYRHVYGYSKKTIQKLLREYGFTIEYIGKQEAEGRNPDYGLRVIAVKN